MTAPPPTTDRMCACCKLHPVTTGTRTGLDVARVRQLITAPDPVVAHIAGVTVALAGEVEDWKRLAAAEPDDALAEVFRKHGAVTAGVVAQLSIVAQDAQAVSGS